MKIAVWHDLPTGGGIRALDDHVAQLRGRGHRIRVWSPPHTASLDEDVEQIEIELPVPRGGRGRLDPMREPTLVSSYKAHGAQVAAAMRAWGADVLYAGSSLQLGTAPIAAAAPSLPSVLYLQEPARHLYEDLGNPPWRAAPVPTEGRPWSRLAASLSDVRRGQRARVLAREEQLSALAFTRVLVNSRFSQESIRRAYGLDAVVCYLGVDAERFTPSDAPREDHVVCVGQFSTHKRPTLVADAVIHARARRLVWVANAVDDRLADAVGERCRAAGVELDLRSGVSDAELVELLGRARVHVSAPSLEPFGFAPLEAGLCGTPAVALAEGGSRETIVHGETGLLAEGGARELGAALRELLDDPDRAEVLGRHARQEYARRFSVSAAGARVERHLLEAAAS